MGTRLEDANELVRLVFIKLLKISLKKALKPDLGLCARIDLLLLITKNNMHVQSTMSLFLFEKTMSKKM